LLCEDTKQGNECTVQFFMTPSEKERLPLYSRSQLALRNGSDREEIWCAFRGIIYDVSRSRLWRKGMHYEHWAGQDLTEELADAPHTETVFDKFEAVGRLPDENEE
jgi:predicted heme/steroid binding protein